MSLIQIAILIFIFYVILRAVLKLPRREISWPLFVLWLIFWLGIAVVDFKPELLNRLANFLGVGRGVDAAIYAAILVLLYSVFRLNVRIQQQEKKITALVRKTAIASAEKKKESL
jgi:hypothetical protein